MGLTTAITAAQVAEITHEAALTGSDEAGGSATLANLLPRALEAVRSEIRHRGYDPDEITNPEDFLEPQAYWVAWRYFAGLEASEENTAKADRYKTDFQEVLARRRPVEGTGDAQARGGHRGPVVLNRTDGAIYLRGREVDHAFPRTSRTFKTRP